MKRYHLLIDCTALNHTQNLISLDFYTVRLIKGFNNSDVFQVFALVCKKNEILLDKLVGFEVPKIVIEDKWHVTPWPQLDRLLGIVPFKNELEAKEIDVTLMPHHFMCNFFFGKKYHQHLIVQDMIPYNLMKEKGKFWYLQWRFFHKLLMRKVKHYISISEGTQKELKRIEGKDSEVVYNSLPFDFSLEESVVDCVKDIHYVLYVSRFAKYKNAETLIRAFASIKDDIAHVLYLKGDKNQSEDYLELKKLISDLNLEDRVILDRQYRSEGEMKYLYSHTDLFVHPSLIEGFGWTPIEAAVSKAPVIVSNIDVMKEVTCGKIPVFDPYSSEDLAAKMLDILNNPPSDDEREQLKVFFLQKYSLKNQIDRMTEVIIGNLKK